MIKNYFFCLFNLLMQIWKTLFCELELFNFVNIPKIDFKSYQKAKN